MSTYGATAALQIRDICECLGLESHTTGIQNLFAKLAVLVGANGILPLRARSVVKKLTGHGWTDQRKAHSPKVSPIQPSFLPRGEA